MTDRNRISLPSDLEAEMASFGADDRAGLIEAWLVAGDAMPVSSAGRNAAWALLQQSIGDARPSAAPIRTPAPPRPALAQALRLVPLRRYLAAAVVLFVVALPFLQSRGGLVYSSPDGIASTEVRLPDGTLVQLGAGSTIELDRAFGQSVRTVSLDGEAFFDVTHQSVPFVVETFSARIEVLGTAFNVRARPGDLHAATRVDLQRGSVRVAPNTRPGMAVRLAPGEATQVPLESVPTDPQAVDMDVVLSWRSGGLSFANAPIGNVLDEMERRYNVAIDAPEDIRLSRVSLFRHSSTTVEELLGDLSDTAGLKYRRTAQGFEVFVP